MLLPEAAGLCDGAVVACVLAGNGKTASYEAGVHIRKYCEFGSVGAGEGMRAHWHRCPCPKH